MATDPQQQEEDRKYGQVVAKAWADEAFKRRLQADPVAVLAEEGIRISPGVQVRVVEDSEQVFHLVIPPKPAEGELSEEQLAEVGAGTPCMSVRCGCGHCACHGGGCHKCDAFEYID